MKQFTEAIFPFHSRAVLMALILAVAAGLCVPMSAQAKSGDVSALERRVAELNRELTREKRRGARRNCRSTELPSGR